MSDLLRRELHKVLDELGHIARGRKLPDTMRVLEIARAALEYGDSNHTGDANCSAGDHDSCTARGALEKLESLLGGPRREP